MPEHRTSRSFIASSALVVVLALSTVASADPIQITSGSLIWRGGTSADITANSATGSLAIQVHGYDAAGIFGPWSTCTGTAYCTAGGTINLVAAWSGLDLPGEMTYQGVTFPLSLHSDNDPSVSMQWSGVLELPDDFAGQTLTAPFSFSGFVLPIGTPEAPSLTLTGHGTATLSFAPYPPGVFPGAFTLAAARYDFEPTPEPASLILLGTGIAGTWATRRRRKA